MPILDEDFVALRDSDDDDAGGQGQQDQDGNAANRGEPDDDVVRRKTQRVCVVDNGSVELYSNKREKWKSAHRENIEYMSLIFLSRAEPP